MTKIYAACGHCESGRRIPGKYGTVCNVCQTYEPSGKADELAQIYFEALQAGEPTDGHLKQLETYFIETLETLETGAIE